MVSVYLVKSTVYFKNLTINQQKTPNSISNHKFQSTGSSAENIGNEVWNGRNREMRFASKRSSIDFSHPMKKGHHINGFYPIVSSQ